MADLDTKNNQLNSSRYPDVLGSIMTVNSNRILLDNVSNWYIFENQIYMGFSILKKYENIIKNTLYEYDVKREHMLRPEYVSYELYGTTDLWYLLLFVNDMKNADEFTKETIYVFPESLLETLNKIVLSEGNMLSSRANPRLIDKHYLKGLDEPSIRLLKDDENDNVDWVELPNFKDDKDSLFKQKYTKETLTINKGLVNNIDGEKVPPFTLNSKGLFNVPSIYYKKGYKQKLTGKIKLETGKEYAILRHYNGSFGFSMSDASSSDTYKFTDSFDFGEPELIKDFRKANNDDISSINNYDIKYDYITGQFSGSSTNKTGSPLVQIIFKDGKSSDYFEDNRINSRMDLKRLDGKQFLLFNLEYSSNFSDSEVSKIDAISYTTTINYTDGSNIKSNAYVLDSGSIYNTLGERSYLKFSMENKNYNNKKISSIQIDIVNVLKSAYKSVSFESSVFSVAVHSRTLSEFMTKIKVNKTSWYKFNMDYDYIALNANNQSGTYKYPKEIYQGIYFKPEIREIGSDGLLKDNTIEVTDGTDEWKKTNNITLKNPVIINEGKPKFNVATKLYTTELELPEKYVMVLKMNHLSKKTGGGVGFVFDYNTESKAGYLIWISTTKENKNTTYLPEYNIVNGYNILPSGLYKMDTNKGKVYPVFEYDLSYVKNILDGGSEQVNDDKVIKVIKKYNNIRFFYRRSSKTNDYDYENPLFRIMDKDNIQINQGIMFVSDFAESKVEILEYYPMVIDEYVDD